MTHSFAHAKKTIGCYNANELLMYLLQFLSLLHNLIKHDFFHQPSPFFTEQLTAFEVWLDHGSEYKKPPEQLPIVLQVGNLFVVVYN